MFEEKLANVYEKSILAVLRPMGLELVWSRWQGSGLQVMIEGENYRSVSSEECLRVHRLLRPALLNVGDAHLEVTSPGIRRPIRTLKDLRHFEGQRICLLLKEPMDGKFTLKGAYKMAQGVLVLQDGEVVVPLERVRSCNLDPKLDWRR